MRHTRGVLFHTFEQCEIQGGDQKWEHAHQQAVQTVLHALNLLYIRHPRLTRLAQGAISTASLAHRRQQHHFEQLSAAPRPAPIVCLIPLTISNADLTRTAATFILELAIFTCELSNPPSSISTVLVLVLQYYYDSSGGGRSDKDSVVLVCMYGVVVVV